MASNTFVLPKSVTTLQQSRLDYNTALHTILSNFASGGQPDPTIINLGDVSGPQEGMLWYKAGSNPIQGQGAFYVYNGSNYTRHGIATITLPSITEANAAILSGNIAHPQLVTIRGDTESRLYMVNTANTGLVDTGSPPVGFSAGNADTLDGIDSVGFLRRNAADTLIAEITGSHMLKLSNTAATSLTIAPLWLTGASGSVLFDSDATKRISWSDGGFGSLSIRSGVYYNTGAEKYITTGSGAVHVYANSDSAHGEFTVRVANTGTSGATPVWAETLVLKGGQFTINDQKIWHAGNDGSGSGLDADTLDGVQGSSFVRTDINTTVSSVLTVDGVTTTNRRFTISGTEPGIYLKDTSATSMNAYVVLDGNVVYIRKDSDGTGFDTAIPLAINLQSGVSNVFSNTIVHSGNYGTYITKTYIDGLNVDSDTLDGIDSAGFVQTLGPQTIDGLKTFTHPVTVSNASSFINIVDTNATNPMGFALAEVKFSNSVGLLGAVGLSTSTGEVKLSAEYANVSIISDSTNAFNNSRINFYVDGAIQSYISAGNMYMTDTHVRMTDSFATFYGTDNDTSVYSNGSNFYIRNSTGGIYIDMLGTGTDFNIRNDTAIIMSIDRTTETLRYGDIVDVAVATRSGVMITTNGDTRLLTIQGKATANLTSAVLRTYRGTDQMFRILASGNVANFYNSYAALSDQRMKDYIVDAGSDWNNIKNLHVVDYKLKRDVQEFGAEKASTMRGVISQELMKTGNKNLVYEDAENDNMLMVNYSGLYMKAVNALREALHRIETLEYKVTELERR